MLTIRLFGQVRVDIDGAIEPLRAPAKAVEALAYLATHRDAPTSRDFLATLLWPDDEPEGGRGKLRRNLHVLARALAHVSPEPLLTAAMQSIRWNVQDAVSVDVIAFAEAYAARSYDEAIAHYGGAFLEGHNDDWILTERERFREQQLDALRRSVRRKRGERDFAGALADIGRILAIDPWREDALRIEMLVRAELGDRSGALAAYRSFAERLQHELGVEPAPDTRTTFEALVRGEAPAVEGPAPSEAPAREEKLLPFVGREREFAALTRAWAEAARGHGRTILLSGEAGAGKSRLSQELALHAESQGGGVLIGSTTPGEARPYEAVADALRGALPLLVRELTRAEAGILAGVLPEIVVHGAVERALPLTPDAERARIFETLFAALEKLARKRPLLVVLEDLHWATPSSTSLIEYLARRASGLPALIVATSREEGVGRTHPLRALRRRLEAEGILEALPVGRLQRDALLELLRRLPERVGEGRAVEERANELYAYSEGVPLFLDEAVYAGRRNQIASRLNVPARIAALTDAARALLEIAVVAGSGFTIELLCEVSGWSEFDVVQALDELVEARFARRGRRAALGDYAFTHHLVQAAVYEALDAQVLRQRHALVAHAETKLFGERPDHSAEIAAHFERGGDPVRAARSYAAAARHALALYANEEALTYAERALALSDTPAHAVDMHILRASAATLAGRLDVRTAALAALSTATLTPQQLPEVERLRAVDAVAHDRFAEAQNAAERFLAAAESTGDANAIVQAHIESATIAITMDRYRHAADALAAAERALAPDDARGLLRILRVKTLLAQRRGARGSEVFAAATRLLDESRRSGDPSTEAEAHNRLGNLAINEQRFADARAHFSAAVDVLRRLGLRAADGHELQVANLAAWTADYETARTLYRKGLHYGEDATVAVRVACTIGLALVDLYTGNARKVPALLDAIAEYCTGFGTIEEANVHLCRALAHAAEGRETTAAAEFDRALAIHREKPPSVLSALTLAFAIVSALDARADARADALERELAALPQELQSGEEFPHLMAWARALVAEHRGLSEAAAVYLSEASRLYDERAKAIGEFAPAYAAVPWNARFLALRDSGKLQRETGSPSR